MKKKRLKKIPGGEANVRKEIELLRRLRHPNVIALEQVLYSEDRQKTYVVMEYCVTGLQSLLDKAEGKRLPLWQAHSYFCQLLSGLEYLHSHGVVHRDIKPGNVLLTRDGTLKISDFGVAEQLDPYSAADLSISSLGSPAFQPPEIALGQEEFSAFKVDIWAVGVTLYNMVTGSYPFTGSNLYNLFQNIGAGEFTIPEGVDQTLADLIRRMLTADPATRCTLTEIRNHPWVTSPLPRDSPAVPLLDPPTTLVSGMPPPTTTLLPYLEAMFPPEGPVTPGGTQQQQQQQPPQQQGPGPSSSSSANPYVAVTSRSSISDPPASAASASSSAGGAGGKQSWHLTANASSTMLGGEGFTSEHRRNISTSSSKIRADLNFAGGEEDEPGGSDSAILREGDRSAPPSLYEAASTNSGGRDVEEGDASLVAGRRGPEEREGLFHTLLRKLSFRKRKSVLEITNFLGSTENIAGSS